ncbi:MAG: hypothetical protein ACOYL6_10975 [Bacteriovoracaceae bacterium]
MEQFLSFRPSIYQLMKNFSHLFEQDDVVPNLLTEIVVTIATFQEEGTKHVPIIFIAKDLNLLLSAVRGSDPLQVGEGAATAAIIHKLFKACGPLGQGRQWAIYLLIDKVKGKIKYGLFRTEHLPLQVTSFERLRFIKEPDLSIIGITRLGDTIVEVCSSEGNSNYIDISGKIDVTQNPLLIINQFVSAVTRDVPIDVKSKIEIFYHRIATEIFSNSHGTLAVVTESASDIPYYLSDGILLKKPFDLSEAVKKYLNLHDEDSTLSLVALGQLIQKMMEMDGVTVFSSSGSVLGYNCFVKDPALLSTLVPAISGGARRRAFEILSTKIGAELIGTLFKSQDGMGDCHTNLTI